MNTIELTNTLTGRKEPFVTREPNHARVYVCGPTVYDYSHLGHGRSCVVYDVLVRLFRAEFAKVTYVRNITDIDDKILNRAEQLGETPQSLAERFTMAFWEDMGRLGISRPDVEPKVSDHLSEIVQLIETLIQKKHAYVVDGDVYFDVMSFGEYGKLSHRRLEQLVAGASGRMSEDEGARKKHTADFALWKSAKEDVRSWDSPWGKGRPGWHIECSAMCMKYLGESFDLHGGGLDLVFPHHENEIAQSESATGKTLATMWVHHGFVEVDNEKMSKSTGNFFTLRDLMARVEPEAIRYTMLTVQYRSPLHLQWTLDSEGRIIGFPQLEEGERNVEYVYGTRRRLESLSGSRIQTRPSTILKLDLQDKLLQALRDDMNTPTAIAFVHEFLGQVNQLCDEASKPKGSASNEDVQKARAGFVTIQNLLGLGCGDPAEVLLRIRDRRAVARGIQKEHVEGKILERAQARAAKDFARADQIRSELESVGIELQDNPGGSTWTINP